MTIASPSTPSDPEQREPHRLDDAERRTLSAIVRRILPSDDGFGAAEANAPEYVLNAVDTRFGPISLKRLRRGLRFADDLARQMSGKPFAEAGPELQDRAFRQLQLTPHPTLQDFVHRMVNLTLEAFLGDPRHGGNRDGVGWRYLGIDVDPVPRKEEDPCTTS